jgi:ABC-2 type transport system ATP-binding protein
MWAEIQRMAGQDQMTVLLTTHYLDEADRLADRLAIVDQGRVVAAGTPDDLKSGLRGDALVVDLHDLAQVPAALAAVSRVATLRDITSDGRTLRARADEGAAALPLALTALDESGLRVASATVSRPSLDDVYLTHTGHTFARAQQGFAPDFAEKEAS